MSVPSGENLTAILAAAERGEGGAVDRLFPIVYDELRRMAARLLDQERPGHTLQPTALVHEAYLKLVDQAQCDWAGSRHFFAVAAVAMRRILVNHAKARDRLKRGGGRLRVTLDESAAVFNDPALDLIALDDALSRLAELDPDQARIVELRFFAGLTVEQVASVLGVSVRTVQYDWAMARAWVRGELAGSRDDDA